MTWVYTPFVGVLWTSAIISIIVAFLLSRRRTKTGVNSLILLMCVVAEWSLASGLEAASIGLAQKLIWSKVEYIGAVSAPVLFFIFTLNYSQKNRWLTPRNLILLFIVPLVALVATMTNEYHGLIWNSFTPSPIEPTTIIYGHGIGYYILVIYDYLLLLSGVLVLARTWPHASRLYRRQLGIILVGSLFPLITGILYSLDLIPFQGLDVTPVSFLITGILLAVGIFMYQLFDLIPIARDTLIENMRDGVLVLDDKDRIADINPIACKLLALQPKDTIGQVADSVLNFWPEVKKGLREDEDIQTEVHPRQIPPLYLDLHISPLYDRHKRFTGRLLIFRDSTARHQMEAESARNVEELRIINRISLAITAGLDMDNILKTLREQCSQVAPIDVFYVALYDPASSLVKIPVYYDDGEYCEGASRDIREHPGIIGNVIQARRTLNLQDNVKQTTRPLVQPDSEFEKPAKSYIGIPLTVRERIIGVMSIQSYLPNAYTQEQVRLLEQIAIHAAIAIENARLYSEEQRLAIIDELTNIYNYRGLIELGTREVERARRFNHPLSILFFDIDDFREFNNTYNHAVGNIVLQAVVQGCRAVLRSVDIFARFGGDEFVALLPETDLANAEIVARRLVEGIAAIKVNTAYGDLGVTISLGVTMLTPGMNDLAALIAQATQAENQAKQGQNSIVAISL